ncbi:MAG: orotidine-5'-phosphate decarboxylase [Candidatus Helarchaeota archaeon]
MNFRLRMIEKIKQKKSIVCVGLDPDINSHKFPKFLLDEKKPKLEFAKMIIDEVHDLVPVIKPNTKYYFIDELDQLKLIVKYAHKMDLEVIGDCKENDIGTSMSMAYQKQFNGFNFDAITVNGYFGSEGIIGTSDNPIFQKWFNKGKGLFVLVKTSNLSSSEIQDLQIMPNEDQDNLKRQDKLYHYMAQLVEFWGAQYDHTIGAVVGLNHPEHLKIIRKLITGILLLPGYGIQGGGLNYIADSIIADRFSIINSSRGVMYAYFNEFKDNYDQQNFSIASRKYVEKMVNTINKHIKL